MSDRWSGREQASARPSQACGHRSATSTMSRSTSTSRRSERSRPPAPAGCRYPPRQPIGCGRSRTGHHSIVSSAHPDVVHGTNYVVPPCRAAQVVTVYDCWFLRHPTARQSATSTGPVACCEGRSNVARQSTPVRPTLRSRSAICSPVRARVTIPLAAVPVPQPSSEPPVPALVDRQVHRRHRHARASQEHPGADRRVRTPGRRRRRDLVGAGRRRR